MGVFPVEHTGADYRTAQLVQVSSHTAFLPCENVDSCRFYEPTNDQKALKRYKDQTYRCYGVLEDQLKKSGGKTILGGDRPTTVGLHFEPWVRAYNFAGLGLENYPLMEKWLNGMGELKEVKTAYQKITGKDPKEVGDDVGKFIVRHHDEF